jgi:hypothetical protein
MSIVLKKTLEDRAASVKISLAKKHINKAPIMRVGMAVDISGSTQRMYERGIIQDAVDRLLGLAANFDDNGEMDMWSFTTGFDALETAKASDYGSYVKKHILGAAITKWGGTSYAPVMKAMIDFYFKGSVKKSGGFFGFGSKTTFEAPTNADIPALGIFITDGVNNDPAEAAKVLRGAGDKPIYWSLVGVGDPKDFDFLKRMADELPNAGFVNLATLDISDEALYDELICDELIEFVKKFKA